MTSFKFVVNDMNALVNAAGTVGMVDTMADATFSPEMFSVMADSYPAIRAAIGLQLWPPYFDHYFCNELRRFWFYISEIFPLAIELDNSGYTSWTFSIPSFYNRAELKFEGPNGLLREIKLGLFSSPRPLYVHEYDLSIFVSIDSQAFSKIVHDFCMFDYVHVIVTSTRVTFSYAIMHETVLTTQNGECIIGGIRAPNQIEFITNLSPKGAFYQMANQVKRVWLCKTCDSNKGVIIAPLGLNARLVGFFCDYDAD